MEEMHTLPAFQLRSLFVKGELSAVEITKHFLKRIEKHNKHLGAFLRVYKEKAEKKAAFLDKKKAKGEPLGKFAGVPIGVKDNTHIRGEITTCGSKFLKNYRAPFSASVVRLLEKEDAILVGKTNLDEFSMGSSNENSAFGKAYNPWNKDCTPGGSSGGSAAAVSARLVPIATGSDTGGSIRQPASYCGIVGLKPSYGWISRYGLVAFGSSLDQKGPLASCVKDAALFLEAVAGPCPNDPTTIYRPKENYVQELGGDLTKKKIGVPWNFLSNLPESSKESFKQSIDTLKRLGASIYEVDLDLLRYSIAVYYILATAEASTNLSRFDGIRYGSRSLKAKTVEDVYRMSRDEGFGAEVKKRILLGTFVLSSGHQDEFYRKAQKMRYLIQKAFHQAFTTCDYVVMPTSPTSAFRFGSFQDPFDMYLQDILTVGTNLACHPAISLPSGYDASGMPLGLQILGPRGKDGSLLKAAYAFESTNSYAKQIPKEFL